MPLSDKKDGKAVFLEVSQETCQAFWFTIFLGVRKVEKYKIINNL